MGRIVRRHPLTDSKYFNMYTVRNDLMHCMDCKGLYGIIFGSVTGHIVYNGDEIGATQDARVKKINEELDKYYVKNPGIQSKLEPIELKNIFPGGKDHCADLRGKQAKAANTRHAMPFLKDLANECLTDNLNKDHCLIHILIDYTLEFNRLVYSTGIFYTADELAKLSEAAKGIGVTMQLLRQRAKDQKQLLWHITPKLHYMQHFPDEAKLISPRVVQCYIEESYIGKISQIWSSSKNGPCQETIQHTALLKYLIWLCIELDL